MKLPLSRPSLAAYERFIPAASGTGAVRTMFLGTSSVLVRDDRTTLLVDGFFTRPSLLRLAAGRIGPDRGIIEACLSRAGVASLDAVFCAHSHHDHALDAPVIAQLFQAPLIGSESTMNLGRGYGLPGNLLTPARDGEALRFGDFEVTLVEGLHSPGEVAPGGIDAPLRPPARYTAWRTGRCYSIFFKHPAGTVLVHASANYVPGKLDAYRADTVYLSVARLGRASEEFRREYWRHVVRATGATSVIPVHWDDFMLPLGQPLRAMPAFMDDIEAAMDFTIAQCRSDGLRFALPSAWTQTDPFNLG